MFAKTGLFILTALIASTLIAQTDNKPKPPTTPKAVPPAPTQPKKEIETDPFSLGIAWTSKYNELRQKFGIKEKDPAKAKPEKQQGLDPKLVEKMKGILLMCDASLVKKWADSEYIEEATKINRNWFKQLADSLSKFAACKVEMEGAEECGRQDKLAPLKVYFEKQGSEIIRLLSKPDKLSDAELNKIREERRKREQRR